MRLYSEYLSEIFPGIKVQKISIDAGFNCPNRDGTIGTGGCIYCRNDSFSPGYCNSRLSVSRQLEEGKKFFSRKYPDMKYLAYFQSYTGTYKKSVEECEHIYRVALESDNVVGIVIGTRPDCIEDDILSLLSEINRSKPVIIELGAETAHDYTLRLINRNHTWNDVENAVYKISGEGIHVGLHLIAGLPGEDEKMILDTIDKVAKLPVETLKLHQLQVLKGTPLHEKIMKGEFKLPYFSLEDYLSLCAEIVRRIPERIVIERFLSQSPPELVISPSWGLKNYEFMTKLAKYLEKNKI